MAGSGDSFLRHALCCFVRSPTDHGLTRSLDEEIHHRGLHVFFLLQAICQVALNSYVHAVVAIEFFLFYPIYSITCAMMK